MYALRRGIDDLQLGCRALAGVRKDHLHARGMGHAGDAQREDGGEQLHVPAWFAAATCAIIACAVAGETLMTAATA